MSSSVPAKRQHKRKISIRTSRTPSNITYDRKLESSFDPIKGQYTNVLAHARLSPRSRNNSSPRPFFLQTITGKSNRETCTPVGEGRRGGTRGVKESSKKLQHIEMGKIEEHQETFPTLISSSSEDENEDDETKPFDGSQPKPSYQQTCIKGITRFCEGQRSWIFLMIVGVLTALLAYILDEISNLLLQARVQIADIISLTNGWWMSYLFYVGWGFAMAPMAQVMALTLHDQSAGSGIPQLKSLMAGYRMKSFLGWRMLMAKGIGVLLALGSGLLIGKEGPFVCIAASIATLLMKHVNLFKHMETNVQLRRDALSAACAAGVAATFGAPIGGVLFAIEVTSSLFQVSSYWKGFFAAVCGAVVFKELQLMNLGRGRLNNVVSLFSTQFNELPYSTVELIPFILIGILSGWLASLYLRLQQRMVALRKRIFNDSEMFSLRGSIMLCATVAGITALLTFPFGTYMTSGLRSSIDDLFHEGNLGDKKNTHSDDWLNSDGSGLLLHLICFIVLKFILSAASLTLPVPFGVIVPVFGIGAALGRLIGEILLYMQSEQELGGAGAGVGAGAGAGTGTGTGTGIGTRVGNVAVSHRWQVTPGGYAVVGAAAFTAGVTHTVSIAVIVFELTSQLSYMLPVLLAVLIARFASGTSGGIFTVIGKQLNLRLDPVLDNDSSYVLTAEDLLIQRNGHAIGGEDVALHMHTPVVTRIISQARLKKLLLRDVSSSEFAVIETFKDPLFLGTVSRYELEEISESDALFQQKTPTESNIHNNNRDETKEMKEMKETKETKEMINGTSTTIELDLVGSELLDLDHTSCIKVSEPLSECVLKFAVAHAQSLFLLRRGRIVGCLHLTDIDGVGL